MIIAGVGGQGVLYLTDLLAEAALQADLPAAASGIRGLSRRGGSVVTGITFGENTFGFVEKGGAHFLIGLELLEAQRCLSYLNRDSTAIIDTTRILPHAVQAGRAQYPSTAALLDYLTRNIRKTVLVTEGAQDMRNIFILGKASMEEGFPVGPDCLERAIRKIAKPDRIETTLKVFREAQNEKG